MCSCVLEGRDVCDLEVEECVFMCSRGDTCILEVEECMCSCVLEGE